MSRLKLLLLAVFLLLALAPVSAGYTNRSLTLTVFSDGYVHVAQVISTDSKATTVKVTLLSSAVSDLVATDENGSPLSYGFAPGGSNITIYTLGATQVALRYDTNSLTSKNGTVWTLGFSSAYNSTVVLPQESTLVSISGTPYSINQTNTTPEFRLRPGEWKISYGVPITSQSITTSVTSGQTGSGGIPTSYLEVGVVAAVLAAAALVLAYRRRRGGVADVGDLRQDDAQVLNFIREKGGKVLEPEIRTRFALPKTSAWRQIKRLERLGYVKVAKIGSQNQIELVKEPRKEE